MAYTLADLRFESLQGQTLTLRLAPGERHRLAFMQGQTDRLAEWFTARLDRRLRVTIVPPDDDNDDDDRRPAPPRPGATQQEKDRALQQPITRQVADLFDARVIDVRPRPSHAADRPPDAAERGAGAEDDDERTPGGDDGPTDDLQSDR